MSLSHLLMVLGQNYRWSGGVIVQKILSTSNIRFMIEAILAQQQKYVQWMDSFLTVLFKCTLLCYPTHFQKTSYLDLFSCLAMNGKSISESAKKKNNLKTYK